MAGLKPALIGSLLAYVSHPLIEFTRRLLGMSSEGRMNSLIADVAARVIVAIANGQEIEPEILTQTQRDVIELYRQSSPVAAFVTMVVNLPKGRVTRTILVSPSTIALSQWEGFVRNHCRELVRAGAYRSQNRYGWILEDPMPGLEVDLGHAELPTEIDPLTGQRWQTPTCPETKPFAQLVAEIQGAGPAVLNEGEEEDIERESDGEERMEEGKSVSSEEGVSVSSESGDEEEHRLLVLLPIDCGICKQRHVPELPDGDGVFQGHPIPRGLNREPLAAFKRRVTKKHSRMRISNYRQIDEEFDNKKRKENNERSADYRKKDKAKKEEMEMELEVLRCRLTQYEGGTTSAEPVIASREAASKGGVGKRKKKK